MYLIKDTPFDLQHHDCIVDLTPDIESTGREVVVISPRVRQRKPGTAALRMFIESIFRHSIN